MRIIRVKGRKRGAACLASVALGVPLWLAVAAGAAAARQNGSPTPAPRSAPQAQTVPARPGGNQRVTLSVVVTDKDGKAVSGLQQDDFTVLDNKRPEKITSFQGVGSTPASSDPPLTVFLLIDNVNVGFTTIAYERDQLVKALNVEGGQFRYPVELDFFTDPGVISRSVPSRTAGPLVAALDAKETALRTLNRTGQFAGEELMDMSLDALQSFLDQEKSAPGRKILIWVTPGWPFPVGPSYLDSKQEEGLFGLIVHLSTALREEGVTLYQVDPLGASNPVALTTAYETFLDGVRKATQSQPGDLALQVLTEQTGGLVQHSSNDIAGEIDRCIAETGAYYILSFDAPAADGPNEYHSLQIKVDKPKVTARTNTAYYDQP